MYWMREKKRCGWVWAQWAIATAIAAAIAVATTKTTKNETFLHLDVRLKWTHNICDNSDLLICLCVFWVTNEWSEEVRTKEMYRRKTLEMFKCIHALWAQNEIFIRVLRFILIFGTFDPLKNGVQVKFPCKCVHSIAHHYKAFHIPFWS